MKNPHTGFARLISAARFSWQGLHSAFRHETAFRQEALAAMVLIPLAVFVADSATEMAALIGTVLLVLIVELLNSAVEAVVDRIGDEFHELAGRAKDMGSAAVLLSLILLVMVWMALLLY
ncbi:MAG: diacylglycerol kinase [Pseudomonadota bacterium]